MKKRALNQDPKKAHGGARKGSGRPSIGNIRLNVNIPEQTKESLYTEAQRLDVAPGELVTEAIQKILPIIKRRKPSASK